MKIISQEQMDRSYILNSYVPLYFKEGKFDIMRELNNELKLSKWIRIGQFSISREGNTECNIYTRNFKFHSTLTQVWVNASGLTFSIPSIKTQSDTIKAVKYCIRVYHNNNFVFAQSGNKESSKYCNSYGHYAHIFLKDICSILKTRNIFDEVEPEADENVKKNFIDFCQKHKDLIDLEQNYASDKLFKGNYKAFYESAIHENYGVSYIFYMDGELLNSQIKENANVCIKLNKESVKKIVIGVITAFDEKNNSINVRFKRSDYYDIPKQGYIEESENVGYKYQKYAFDAMMQGRSNNKHILSVILEHKYKQVLDYQSLDFKDTILNLSQQEAINKARSIDDLVLVQGPPGTGKTTIIIEIMKLFRNQGKRVLISSQNNLAVDNVLEKCVKEKVECIRLGREESIGVDAVKPVWVENLIIFTQQNIAIKSKNQEEELKNNAKDKLEGYVNTVSEIKISILKRNKCNKELGRKKFIKTLLKILCFFHIISRSSHRYQSFYSAYVDLENKIAGYNKLISLKAKLVNYVLSGKKDIHNLDKLNVNYQKMIKAIPKKIQVVGEWQEVLDTRKESLIEPLLKSVPVVGATCIGTSTRKEFRDTEYDVVIVDESGQITLHDIIVPITKAKKVILVGDHLQLPPSDEMDLIEYIINNSKLEKENVREIYSKSLFEQLFNYVPKSNKIMLDTQFRMHSFIANFISKEFYDGKYKSGCEDKYREIDVAGYHRPIKFIDTRKKNWNIKCEREVKPKSGKYYNVLEADIIAKEVSKIIKELPIEVIDFNGKEEFTRKLSESDIGIIAPYNTQIAMIKDKLESELCYVLNINKGSALQIISKIEIKSVDSFQGRDKEIVFYSFTRSNKAHKIGFLREVRRLNVMMSRAKRLLVMVGDGETLEQTKAEITFKVEKAPKDYFYDLIQYCKQNECYKLLEDV